MDSARAFWSRVDVRPLKTVCWEWTGADDSRGYGNLRWGGGTKRAHRVAYELAKGPIPEGDGHHGSVILHACDNRLCCNPHHLSVGTQSENVQDMVAKGRHRPRRGERNGRAILTSQQANEIRNSPLSQRALARQYGVSRAVTQRIKTGRSWVSG